MPTYDERLALVVRSLESTVTPYGNSARYGAVKCPRYGVLRSRGIRLVDPPDALSIGSLVHSVLAYVALGAMNGHALSIDDPLNVAAAEGKKQSVVDETRRLCEAYFEKWGYENAGYGDAVILDVERLRSCVIDGDVKHTTRPDAEIATGQRVCVVDHKTAASMPSASDDELVAIYKTNPQFLGHAAAFYAETGEIPSVLVNRLVKTKKPAFRRIFVDFTKDDINRWATEHARMARWLEHANGCANYSACAPEGGRKCDMFSYCHGTDAERKVMYTQPSEGDK